MLKRIGQILTMLLVLATLAMPYGSWAQDASTLMRAQRNANNPNDPFNTASSNGYGSNPYSGQNGTEGDPNAPDAQGINHFP